MFDTTEYRVLMSRPSLDGSERPHVLDPRWGRWDEMDPRYRVLINSVLDDVAETAPFPLRPAAIIVSFPHRRGSKVTATATATATAAASAAVSAAAHCSALPAIITGRCRCLVPPPPPHLRTVHHQPPTPADLGYQKTTTS